MAAEMVDRWWARAVAVFAGGALGTGLRLGILNLIGHEVIALAAINLLGCFVLGLISGLYRRRVTLVRLFLAVGGVASFTSWSTLALQSLSVGGVLIAVLETAFGVFAAGMGHLAGWRITVREHR
ncbi:CrcB family protein [Tessaracoccus sp. ZS01]|uniref:fluoride efflux transporter FluC n=1 Tax=Tessaracoccus sp. ZS01 TaxID=1906324 RepID=UPI00117EB663|nr:CrcB family protein [Tessaracoccus sp. ZS01]